MQRLLSLLVVLSVYFQTTVAFAQITVNGQLKGALFEKSASDLTSWEGRVYYNTSSKYPKFHNGTGWQNFSSAGNDQAVGKSADYTVLDNDNVRTIFVTTSSTTRTMTLPTVADNTNRVISIKKVDSGIGTVILDGEGSETIDGATTYTINAQYDEVTVQSDGSAWFILDRSRLATSSTSGLMSTTTQSLAGNKTFTGTVSVSGTGGNVAHACTRRTNSCGGTNSCIASCTGSEVAVGGGCSYSGASGGGAFNETFLNTTSYTCTMTSTPGTATTAQVMCCLF